MPISPPYSSLECNRILKMKTLLSHQRCMYMCINICLCQLKKLIVIKSKKKGFSVKFEACSIISRPPSSDHSYQIHSDPHGSYSYYDPTRFQVESHQIPTTLFYCIFLIFIYFYYYYNYQKIWHP